MQSFSGTTGCAGEKPLQSGVWLFSLVRRRSAISWGGLVLCMALFFTGCASLIPKNTIVNTIITEPMVGAAKVESASFGLIGRASVKGGKESFSGGVQWHHAGDSDEILLLSPLGQTLAQIQRTSDGVYLTTSEQQRYYATDVESLTEQVLGWRLPLMGLQYWIQSTSSPVTASAVDIDIDGRIAAIRQDGWEINYLSYFPMSQIQTQTAQALTARPQLMILKRMNFQIKLVIDHWNTE